MRNAHLDHCRVRARREQGVARRGHPRVAVRVAHGEDEAAVPGGA
ncbi:hypothetical protein GA0115246_108105, partial [Streptomyces sp. SolWspMP-sol7th]